jgi:hypothetical protein
MGMKHFHACPLELANHLFTLLVIAGLTCIQSLSSTANNE